MKEKIKTNILFVLAIIVIIDIFNAFISLDYPLFVLPFGTDKEMGEAIGYDTWRIIELAIVFYAFRRYTKKKHAKKINKQSDEQNE